MMTVQVLSARMYALQGLPSLMTMLCGIKCGYRPADSPRLSSSKQCGTSGTQCTEALTAHAHSALPGA